LKIRNLGEQVVAGLRACVEITTIEIAPRSALSKKTALIIPAGR
jgi:hypothetical protein